MRPRALLGLLLVGALVTLVPAPGEAKAKVFIRRVFDLEAVVTKVVASEQHGDSDINLQLRPVDRTVDEATLHSSVIGRAHQSVPRFLYESWHPHAEDDVGKTWPEYLEDFFAGRVPLTAPAFARGGIRRADLSATCRACAGLSNDEGLACQMSSAEENPCPRLFSCRDCLYDLERLSGQNLNRFLIEAELFFGSQSSKLNPSMYAAMAALGLPQRTGDLCVERGWDPARGEWYTNDTISPPDSICGKRVLISGWATSEQSHDAKPEIHPVSAIVIDWGRGADTAPGSFTVGAFVDGSHGPSGQTGCSWFSWIFDPIGCLLLHSVAANIESIWMFNYRKYFSPEDYPFTAERPTRVAIDLAALEGEAPAAQTSGSWAKGAQEEWEADCDVEPILVFNTPHLEQSSKTGRCQTLLVGLDRAPSSGAAWMARVKAGWRQAGSSLRVTPHLDTPGGLLPAGPPAGEAHHPQLAGQPDGSRPPIVPGTVQPVRSAPSSSSPALMEVLPMHAAPCVVTPQAPEQPLPKHFGTPLPQQGKPLQRSYRWTLDVKAQVPLGIDAELSLSSLPAGVVRFGMPEAVPSVEAGAFHRRVPVLLDASARHGVYSARVRAAITGRSPLTGQQKEFVWDSAELRAPHPAVRIEVRDARLVDTAAGPLYQLDLHANAAGFCGAPAGWRYAWRTQGGVEAAAVAFARPAGFARAGLDRVPLFTSGSGPVQSGPQTQLSLRPGEAKTVTVVVTDAWNVEEAIDAEVVTAPLLAAHLGIGCHTRVAGPTASSLCREVWLLAAASEKSYGAQFPRRLEGLEFDWRDLRYQSAETGWRWTDVPEAWMGTPENTRPGIAMRSVRLPTPELEYRLQASVTVRDRLGRSATATASGSNDFTPPERLRDRLSTLWRTAWPGNPLPQAAAAGLGRSATGHAAEFSALLHQASRLGRDDHEGAYWLRRQIDALGRHALAEAARDPGRRLAYAAPAAPLFSAPVTVFSHGKDVQARAARETSAILLRPPAPAVAGTQAPWRIALRGIAAGGTGHVAPGTPPTMAGTVTGVARPPGGSSVPVPEPEAGPPQPERIPPEPERVPPEPERIPPQPERIPPEPERVPPEPERVPPPPERAPPQPERVPPQPMVAGTVTGVAVLPSARASVEEGTDRPGMDLRKLVVPGALDTGVDQCRRACEQERACRAYTYVRAGLQGADGVCWLKSGVPAAVRNECCVSGVKPGAQEPEGAQPPAMVVGTVTGVAVPPPTGTTWVAGLSQESGFDRPGMDYHERVVEERDVRVCAEACRQDARCRAYTYVRPEAAGDGRAHCFLKSGVPGRTPNACCISGAKAID